MEDDWSDVGWEYQAKLAELKINSKPLIDCLTMMAEDYIRQAPVVVQTIEKQLLTVRPEMKLPILYLIDSIIKNVRKGYGALFTLNIVSTFTKVFETADVKVRHLLYQLRATWNDFFPAKKLQAIDLKCNSIDAEWPMLSGPAPGSIHVNPRLIKANLFEKRDEEVRMNPWVSVDDLAMAWKQSEPEADQRKSPEQTLEKIRSQLEASYSSNEETQGSVYQGLEPEAITGATDVTGERLLAIKFWGLDKLQLVPTKVANVRWPQMVIAFYEERVKFDK